MRSSMYNLIVQERTNNQNKDMLTTKTRPYEQHEYKNNYIKTLLLPKNVLTTSKKNVLTTKQQEFKTTRIK